MDDKASLLSQCLSKPLSPPAKRPSECRVEPSIDQNEKNNLRKKRKLSSSFQNCVETFLGSGCCVIPNVLPIAFVQKCKSKASSDLEFLTSELASRRREAIANQQEHLLSKAVNVDFRELVDRDGGRRDVRFQLDRYPFCASGLIRNSIVFPLVQELLGGGDVNLLYAGVMWAQAKDPTKNDNDNNQKWHGDGGHLFEHTHLPPHCINVFFPLVDLTMENGPTEFKSGSHRLGHFDDDDKNAQFALCCDAGGAVLFDYRTKHRGLANLTSTGRPILYLAYAKPFFRDAGNIRSGQSLLHSASARQSSPWVARILSGNAAMAMGEGFDEVTEVEAARPLARSSSAITSEEGQMVVNGDETEPIGSGERWVLFRMNVELPAISGGGDDEDGKTMTKTLIVYSGDGAFIQLKINYG